MNNDTNLTLTFDGSFLEDHARLIMTDAKTALVELIANCWDAGANRIDIVWPDPAPDNLKIKDDGIGMSRSEFERRWLRFNYDRKREQGEQVIFPVGNIASHRRAFGRNGKGRFSMFCFSNEYFIETWKDGKSNTFCVKRNNGLSALPFNITHVKEIDKPGHGTEISGELVRNHLSIDTIRDLIGSKFITDPTFNIYVNEELVKLTDLEHLFDRQTIFVADVGEIIISCIDSHKVGRTSKQHGVAWWVQKRLVGEPSWRGFDDDAYLDARSTEAKRYTFVVEADILIDDVREDWGEFKDTERFRQANRAVRNAVLKKLRELMVDEHKSAKMAAVRENRREMQSLSPDSRLHVGQFIDTVQARIPTINQKVLSTTVEILSKLEQSRSKYALLDQLMKLNPDDIDNLNDILSNWSVQEARIVLNELQNRLKLIESLTGLVDNPAADELHQIHPLFSQGLWIFGPEYESIQFISNVTLLRVIQDLFQDNQTVKLDNPKRRPDFVILPNSTIGVYASDDFNRKGEVNGFAKVLIIELKKGGSEITVKERRQAEDYVLELRKSGKIQPTTELVAVVLGSRVSGDCTEVNWPEQNTRITPYSYSVILRFAHARTFNLLEKIRKAKDIELSDPEIDRVLQVETQSQFV
ncbi:Histidine kinase-, DNA gyrase B-, and HSP90-like ATPase [Dehalogenimonas formicexedens]|uniref:Histidine kinase-, DNA gyrase B-, and HSP90-like ATPase n=1 Tax=Dehalogenimonas formicexedens TaxID=1839801 RepID=A0A1P8F7L3_9CHLR|nr:ATP-binding protein [Dehalogenimonas formicexedens]APV44469.1 Histidine kinase-, DNA gyrase B-, and HSP90-like ATPase [Dehalogenimonas formicexedens]